MNKFVNKIAAALFVLLSGAVMAQTDTTETGVGTEKLIIITPYSPTVSDAVKPTQIPDKSEDASLLKKKEINYNILSFPVASTFKPDKGKASGVDRIKRPDLYDSYAALGIGNYTNIMAEFYSNIQLDNKQKVLVGFEHLSSQGGIKKARLRDKFYDTRLDLHYKTEEDNFYWGGKVGLLHKVYNWYGVFDENISQIEIDKWKTSHTYMGANIGAEIEMKKGVFDRTDFDYQYFTDNYQNREHRIQLKPNLLFPAGDLNIHTTFNLDFLNGNNGFKNAPKSSYSNFIVGVHPAAKMNYDNWAFNIGAELTYASHSGADKGKFHIYPRLKGSYQLADEYLTLYGELSGGMKQNTYYDFTAENPYTSPDIYWIMPTDTQYDFTAGVNGELMENLHYDLHAGYKSEKNKALFLAYFPSGFTSTFRVHNGFNIVYDHVKTLSFEGSVNYLVDKNFNLGLGMGYYNYNTKDQKRAWNLPELQARISADYKFTPKWSAGADLFFMGERNDIIDMNKRVKVKSYFDANLRLDFQATDQLGFFLKGSNLTGDNYKRWYGYPVQGIQGMFGMSYQF